MAFVLTRKPLQVAVDANAAAYRRAIQTSAPGDCWDVVVLTAANEKQAQGYRQELALRNRGVGPAGAFFPAIQKSIVVADPPGRRAGSGGATLGVMRAVCEQFHLTAEDFRRLRILLIHSGGASQRLPAYSPLGKIFAPLPLLRPDGQISTLFDHLYVTLAGLPERLGPGMLILAGDVFLLFDHRHVATPAAGVTALTMRVEAELGRGHGVFLTDEKQRILRTMQKAPVEAMREAGAVDEQGRVMIDTGLLFFDPQQTALLAQLAGIGKKAKGLQDRFAQQIDLYEDMTAALAQATERGAYLSHSATRSLRTELWKRLHGVPFQTMLLEGQFLHLGTTRQFRDAMVGHSPCPAAELFQQNVLVHSDAPLPEQARVYHSVLMGKQEAGGGIDRDTVIEHSILSAGSRIGSGCVVSQVFAANKPLTLAENLLFFQVPIRSIKAKEAGLRHVQVLCGVEDDFKTPYGPGQCLFLNRPMEEFLKRFGLTPGEVWPGIAPERRTLWTAKLFPGTVERDAADAVLWFASKRSRVKQWKKWPRFSMADLLEQADPLALIEHRETVAAYLQTQVLLESIRRDEDKPLDSFIGHYSTPAAYRACLDQLAGFAAAGAAPLQQSRACWCAAQLLQRPDYPANGRDGIDQHMTRAFGKVAEASEIQLAVGSGQLAVKTKSSPIVHGPLQTGLRIEAASPVRLDLSGGWSDTPPYCYERGGHVVNLAIDLDRQPPVRAMVRTLHEPVLILESHDLGTHLEITSREQLRTSPSVHDPFALHKVALDLVGLLPRGGTSLQAHLKQLGAGLIVSTECRVPKGSGLGTSSILSATLLAAMYELFPAAATENRRSKIENLISQTLLLEQRLSTGGGWQDQVGGIVGGLKSTTTEAGIPQRPVVEELALSQELYQGLQERLVVYYSGQQRLARDILRRVMGRYLAREPFILRLLEELKQSAAALRAALLKGRWKDVGGEIGRYWEIKKQLYPGSTTPTIDVLFLEFQEHYLAAGLAGAGGGGFAYFFCKDARQAQRLRQRLAERSSQPGSLGTLFDTQINRAGLVVTRRSS